MDHSEVGHVVAGEGRTRDLLHLKCLSPHVKVYKRRCPPLQLLLQVFLIRGNTIAVGNPLCGQTPTLSVICNSSPSGIVAGKELVARFRFRRIPKFSLADRIATPSDKALLIPFHGASLRRSKWKCSESLGIERDSSRRRTRFGAKERHEVNRGEPVSKAGLNRF
ncbi:hypothetical protein RIF29_20439 [Crotalaria pallida]|uniref:Uncharacterized protein n=1 Tax=Crotalaria pallida TaxID=3830 RepID=A0AAN9I8P2_CROPI